MEVPNPLKEYSYEDNLKYKFTSIDEYEWEKDVFIDFHKTFEWGITSHECIKTLVSLESDYLKSYQTKISSSSSQPLSSETRKDENINNTEEVKFSQVKRRYKKRKVEGNNLSLKINSN